MSVRVKICGVTDVDDARMIRDAGAFAIGLNFFRGSPRYVTPERAAAIVAATPELCAVGVFVNQEREQVEAVAESVGLHALQFHGDEDPAYCAGWSRKVVKALRIRDRASLSGVAAYAVDYVLVDAYADDAYGGTGKQVRWELLQPLDKTRLVLAGGLDPDNVAAAVRQVRPFAVDVASGVEIEPGRKDPVKVERFIANATAA